MSGCGKWLFVGFYFFSAFFFLAFGVLTSYFVKGKEETAMLAKQAPIKSLETVKIQDGPAWVRITLSSIATGPKMLCASESCLWKKKEGSRIEKQEIRREGKWIQRKAIKFVSEDPQNVPFEMKDGKTVISVNDWLGIEIGKDLLNVRTENTASDSEMLKNWNASQPMKVGMKEYFLSDGAEAWALGNFQNGKPQVYLNGAFYLTGVGPERFLKDMESGLQEARIMVWISYIIGIFFGILFLKNILKRESNKGNLSPSEI
ncbi:MAG: hypothetical protein HQM08_18825 [Candidatus Riflebacteria bacterium]|nr:hypothetical protein [Candidatus Riflebacteria bacterium]